MSVLTDLERLEVAYLTAKVAYEYAIQRSAVAWDERDKYHEARDALMRAVTDDTIRALLDVAGEGVCPICHMRMAEGVYRNEDDEYVACPAAYHAALAPLVKEGTTE